MTLAEKEMEMAERLHGLMQFAGLKMLETTPQAVKGVTCFSVYDGTLEYLIVVKADDPR